MTEHPKAITRRKYTRLPESSWAEITALWESGEATLQEISDQYGPTPRALQAYFRRKAVVKGSRAAAMATAVRKKIEEEDLDSRDLLVARAREIRERAFRNANTVEDLIMGQLAMAERDPSQVIRIGTALKALSLASASLERLHDLKQKALGLDKDAALPPDLPVLEIRELTAEDVERLRVDQGADADEFHEDLVEREDQDNSELDEVIFEDSPSGVEDESPCPVLPDGSRLVRGAE